MLRVVKTYLISASFEQAEVVSGVAFDVSECISAGQHLGLIFFSIAILLLK